MSQGDNRGGVVAPATGCRKSAQTHARAAPTFLRFGWGRAVSALLVAALMSCAGSSPQPDPADSVQESLATSPVTAATASSPVIELGPALEQSDDIATRPPTPESSYEGWVDPATVGENVGLFDGLLTFRGNPTRTYYGKGPVPADPTLDWKFGTGDELCSLSTVGADTTEWCGTGWTGQPAIFDYDDRRWVVFGSFAPALHFLDASTGERMLADLAVGDLIKGSVTIDPEGFALVYFGSRDGYFRIVSFDGPSPRELWRLNANDVASTKWNDDWDGTPVVVDGHLFVGGENSNLHIVKLNRSLDASGLVQVAPELVFAAPGWDEELLEDLPDENVSIETAITIVGDDLWFANSGGLVQAWDIGGLKDGETPTRSFRFWTGDDTDASIVIDDEGFAYVGVEVERAYWRGIQLGQLIKLDPRRPEDPVVWSRDLHVRIPDGIWATPALHRDVLYVPTNEGNLHAIDRATGDTRWQTKLQGPVWSSPVVVDDVLIQADCDGGIHAWDVADTSRTPIKLWSVTLPWCIESTPAVWDGQIVVGHRRGEVWSLRDE